VNQSFQKARVGFTLVELLIGMSLAVILLGAVLTSYVTLGRNFTRSLGISSANQPTLESQARRTLAYFVQDVRMASGFKGSPTANSVILTLPSSTGNTTMGYANDTTSPTNQNLYRVPAANSISAWNANTAYVVNDFVYKDGAGYQCLAANTGVTPPNASDWKSIPPLHSSLVTCTINYYDASGNIYTSADLSAGNYLPGIKQLSISLVSQAGSSANGTLTQQFETDSARVIMRNKALLQ
jgi:Tfp pilus assembly protein PilW